MALGSALGGCQGRSALLPAHRQCTGRNRRQPWPATCPRQQPSASAAVVRAFSSLDDLDGGDQLASEFAAHIGQLALKAPLQHRRPSPLDPPTATVAAQMDALQINDWPEPDAGVHTALAFAKPYQCEELVTASHLHGHLEAPSTVPLPAPSFGRHKRSSSSSSSSTGDEPGHSSSSSTASPSSSINSASYTSSSTSSSSGSGGGSNGGGSNGGGSSDRQQLVRSWSAREAWLTPQEFASELHSSTYAPLLGCDSWRACSNIVFPPTRAGNRAVQAVEVLAPRRDSTSTSPSPCSRGSNHNGSGSYTYTFVLERIGSGPYRGCWLTIGVRPGNYAL